MSLLLVLVGLTCLSVGFVIGKLWGHTHSHPPVQTPAQNEEEIQKLTELIALKSTEAADWKRAYESMQQSYNSMKDAYESMTQAADSYEAAAESNRQAYEDMKSANESLRSVIGADKT
jgi:tRNA U34 5-carboxymethylaminomethyl modifying GTPase MnmE/TrmE